MIVRSGNAVSFLVEFPSGVPDGNVTWSVLGPTGAVIDSGTVVVPDAAVSVSVTVPALANTLAGGDLISYRDVVWSYSAEGEIVNDERRYTVEARVPFGASPSGVRNKLGVEPHELPDKDISLVTAYLAFVRMAGVPGGPYTDAEEIAIRNAIEAAAALQLLPTMQVRVALKEGSGTDSFQRDKIDWLLVQANLEGLLTDGVLVLLPTFDLSAGFGAVFILAPPSADPFPAA